MDSSIVHSSCMNAILLLCFFYALTAVGGSRLLDHAHRNHHTKHSFRPKTVINSNDSYSSPSPPPSPSASPDCDSPTTFDVQSYGAVGDGICDDTEAFQLAWQAACYTQSGVMLVPDGYTFLIQSTMFYGPCKEGITFQVDGIVLAPDGPEKWAKNSSHLQWIVFYRADGLVLQGSGLVDGRGENWWNLPCKPHRGPNGTTLPGTCESPTAIRFFDSKNLTLRNLHIRNSPQMHVRFDECESVLIDSINIQSPQLSPNTDGIHLSGSQDVQIYNSIVGTGDDCISIVAGCSNVDIQNMTCGPSHGISIGGLGNHNSQACVKNVSVDHAFIKNSDNGLRIKTWQGGIGWVSGVTFSNVYMQNVRNPIIIDQFYCFTKGCRNESDAVFVTDVMYNNIKGTYDERSPAVHLACSDAMPCTNITLTGVELFPAQGQMIQDPFCWNAYGSISSLTIPLLTCLNNGSPQSLRDPARFHPCQAPY